MFIFFLFVSVKYVLNVLLNLIKLQKVCKFKNFFDFLLDIYFKSFHNFRLLKNLIVCDVGK